MGFVYGSTLRLDATGDVVLTPSKDLSLVTEREKLTQDLTVLLRSQKYQYMFKPDYGVDYKGYLADKMLTRFVNTDVLNALSDYYFTKSVDTLYATTSGKELTIHADLTLLNGDTVTIQVTI